MSDEAYVLRTQELGETDLIVSLFSRIHGRVRAVARGARKSRRRFGGRLEPLTHVQARWTERAGRDLHRLESIELERSFASMQADPGLQAVCAVLCELTDVFAREGESDDDVFRLLGRVLEALERGLSPWVALRYFEFWLLRLHGLLPDPEQCGACGRPGAEGLRVGSDGLLRCRSCLAASGDGGLVFGDDERAFVVGARRRPPEELAPLAHRCAPGGVLERWLRRTAEQFAERGFRTYRHLSLVRGTSGTESER